MSDDRVDHARRLPGQAVQGAPNGTSAPLRRSPDADTVPHSSGPPYPGDPQLEQRLRGVIRWNGMAMVLQADLEPSQLERHLERLRSGDLLYEVGFNHFWHAPSAGHPGDVVYMQPHSAPVAYARAFLEGRLSEDQLRRFGQEVNESGHFDGGGLPPCPHPRLMPDFWPFPAVSTGLSPGLAVHQARLMKYLQEMGLASTEGRDVWAVLSERDVQEPEALRAIALAGEEQLANLVFVVHCQGRPPGAAGGDCAETLRELRAVFHGAEWKVIEVASGAPPEPLPRVDAVASGEYAASIHASYNAAAEHTSQPAVILAPTVTEAVTDEDDCGLLALRDRFKLPLSDDDVRRRRFWRPPADSAEMRYLHERRAALGGELPARRRRAAPLAVPPLLAFSPLLQDTGEGPTSSTTALSWLLDALLQDEEIGRHVVAIGPGESRAFGGDGRFSKPVAAFSSWIAAATSYSNHAVPMIPFYVDRSVVGVDRICDLAWAAGKARARGFLMSTTGGHTTADADTPGEADRHAHVLGSAIPSCVSYDPAYGFELAVIVHDGLRRMLLEQEDVFYFVTLANPDGRQPAMPRGSEDGIAKGMYLLRDGGATTKGAPRVQLLGSGSILGEVLAAAILLETSHGVTADVWSVTSFTELAREGVETERWNLLHPTEEPRRSYVERCLADRRGPVVAASEHVRAFAEQIRPFVRGPYRVLGTDGWRPSGHGRALRRFFEVDRHYVTLAALGALADDGVLESAAVARAIESSPIDPDRPAPLRV